MEYQDICAQDICAPSLDVARFFEKRGWCLWNGGSQPNWHKSWKTFCETAIILLLYLKLSFFFYIWIKLRWMKVQISESKKKNSMETQFYVSYCNDIFWWHIYFLVLLDLKIGCWKYINLPVETLPIQHWKVDIARKF